jgi:nucleotide-binding universal stress UspA family protein
VSYLKQKIKKILVPLDGSKNSFKGLTEAIYLARQCGATLTGVCVIPIYTINLGKLLTRLKIESAKQVKKFMAEARRLAAQNGIVFYEKIIYGNEVWEITEFASYKKFDVIVMGSRGIGSVKEAFLGSVANSVVHKSKVPVLVVKYQNILIRNHLLISYQSGKFQTRAAKSILTIKIYETLFSALGRLVSLPAV